MKSSQPVLRRWGFASLTFIFVLIALAQSARADDRGWPRTYEKEGQKVVVHQPQIDEWPNFTSLAFRSAIALTAEPGQEPAYGVLEVHAKTLTDQQARTVILQEPRIEVRFPNEQPAREAQLQAVTKTLLPELTNLNVSLDRVLTYLNPEEAARPINVSLDPPKIFYSDKPAILVIYMGKPSFKPIKDTPLMFAVNTNWDILMDTATSKYYLLNDNAWLTSMDPEKGPWMPTTELPADFAKIPMDPNWEDVLRNIPGQPSAAPPTVVTSTEPAELIVTEGEPAFGPVPNTALMDVTNTESDLFRHNGEQQFYYLVAGRWFRAKDLNGPWTAASTDLPGDFAKLPEDHARADVLASVPGTEDAADAVLLAEAPQMATVNVKDVSLAVEYNDAPKFVSIEGTQLQYAVNTPESVILAEGKYYCCSKGIWFESTQPSGPWTVCTVVPASIYTIPANHPLHNVTYVYVYETTPETVVVGHTGGYSGQYVAATGVLMFGAGVIIGNWLDDDDHHYHYGSSYYSYGCGASYNYAYGGYYRGASVYGPYGGAGRAAAYNASTGTYSRAGYRYGPNGGVAARQAYNPYSDTYAARAGGSNGYSSWSRGVVSQGDDWVAGGRNSSGGRTAGWVETSEGNGAVGVKTRNDAKVVAGSEGNVYAGKDGNVYRRDEDGNWQKNEGAGNWNNVDRPNSDGPTPRASANQTATQNARSNASAQQPANSAAATRPAQQPATRPSAGQSTQPPTSQPTQRPASTNRSSSGNLQQQLNSQASARQRGNTLSTRSQQSYSRPSTSRSAPSRSAPSRGASRSGGGGSRGGGGGGRR